MRWLSVFALLASLLASSLAHAAEPPEQAAPSLPDLFTVRAVRVDATSDSAIQARDQAMVQGRSVALTALFRRFTASANWGRQPQLDDLQVLRLVRSFEVSNERRSTTRYVADVTFHFNPAAVRAFLRRTGIAFTEMRSRPVLIVPVTEGKAGYDPSSPWAMAWMDPSLEEGLVPVVLPDAGAPELAALAAPDATQLDWAALAPLARRYDANDVVLAIAAADAKSVQIIELSMMGRRGGSLAFAQSTFTADAGAVWERLADEWKNRSAIDFGTRGRMVADVRFGSLGDWAKIRADLAAVRAVADVDVMGIALNEAQVGVSYFGRPEQLIDALAQQNLILSRSGEIYTLQLGDGQQAGVP